MPIVVHDCVGASGVQDGGAGREVDPAPQVAHAQRGGRMQVASYLDHVLVAVVAEIKK